MLIVLNDLLSGGEIEIEFPFQENWNMIGLPINVSNSDYQFLFPNAVENTLFSFTDGGYAQETQLIPGTGYWLRFSSEGLSFIAGQSIDELPIELSEGWNMISGISETISVSSINDPDQRSFNKSSSEFKKMGISVNKGIDVHKVNTFI